MLLRPVSPAAHRPDIDQISHHVERLEIVLAQKSEQSGGVGAARARCASEIQPARYFRGEIDVADSASKESRCGALNVLRSFLGGRMSDCIPRSQLI